MKNVVHDPNQNRGERYVAHLVHLCYELEANGKLTSKKIGTETPSTNSPEMLNVKCELSTAGLLI
jgi:hypothetical protein